MCVSPRFPDFKVEIHSFLFLLYLPPRVLVSSSPKTLMRAVEELCLLVTSLHSSHPKKASWFVFCDHWFFSFSLGPSEASCGLAVRTRPGLRGRGRHRGRGPPRLPGPTPEGAVTTSLLLMLKWLWWNLSGVYILDLRRGKKLGGVFFKCETPRGCSMFPTDKA